MAAVHQAFATVAQAAIRAVKDGSPPGHQALEAALQRLNASLALHHQPEQMPLERKLQYASLLLEPTQQVAAELLSSNQQQQHDPAERQLALAQAAATRSCAYLRCANLGGEGGPAAGEGAGSMRCRWAVGWASSELSCCLGCEAGRTGALQR